MLEPQHVLRYLSHATSLGGGGEVAFDGDVPSWSVDVEALTGGILDADVTREVLGAYALQCADVPFGERPVPVVLCARWFVAQEDEAPIPLLLIPATLDVGGSIRRDPKRLAWIPWDRLATDGTYGAQPTVCTLDTLRAHQQTMRQLPDDGGWATFVERALALFDAVCTIEGDPTANGRLDAASVRLRIWDAPDELAATSELLDALGSGIVSKGTGSLPMPLRTLLGDQSRQAVATRDELHSDELLDSKLLCGVLDVRPGLSANDRATLLRFVRQHSGDVLAMHAPEGTNRVAVALSAMANYLTECALRGERAPVIACLGTDATLAAISRALLERPFAGQTSLPSRWLPRIAQDDARPESRRILGPVPTVAMERRVMSGEGDAVAGAFRAYLGHPLLGDAASYSDPWYVPKATIYFLDCVSGFLGRRVREVAEAATALSERLRQIDQERCELIDAYANVCRAARMLAERDELLHSVVELRTKYREAREQLRRWDALAVQNPVRRTRVGRPEEDQRELVRKSTHIGETIPVGHRFVTDVCDAYRTELERIERELDELRGRSAEITQRVRASASEGQRCVETIAHLQVACGLTAEQTKWLESTIDGRDVAMGRLDDVLDRTVRAAEFWLAVHVYEARWLIFAGRDDSLARALRSRGVVRWRASSNLCPINLIPCRLASAAIMDARGEHVQAPLPPFDLVVALDADECDVATGAVMLGHAGRALVIGSEASLGPRQPQGRTSDALYALGEVRDSWEELVSAHLVASGGASLARALFRRLQGECTQLVDVPHAYDEIDDLRGALVPSEMLRSVRVPPSGADDPSYALLGIVPTLSHVLVPDSSWQQIGPSRVNRAEAMAIVRWLGKHARRISERYELHGLPAIGVVSAHRAQARLLGELLAETSAMRHGQVEVVSLGEARGRTWPVVVASATCGPAAYRDDCACDASAVLSLMAAHCQDAMVLFWGGAWLKSDDPAALTYLRRATLVGRLYSVVREGRIARKARLSTQPRHLDDASQLPPERDLRAKPLSLTTLLRRLHKQGELPSVPSTSKMNRALEQVGLIERVTADGGHSGWRPTPAGREVGILATSDRKGNPFCSYAPSTAAVIASTAMELLEKDE